MDDRRLKVWYVEFNFGKFGLIKCEREGKKEFEYDYKKIIGEVNFVLRFLDNNFYLVFFRFFW